MSVTEAGRSLAARLPFEAVHGHLAETVRERWREVDAFVLFVAVGAAVRAVAPLLVDKRSDPPVVCVDEAGRFAVAVCGGHGDARRGGARPGANALARQVAALLGAEAVVTTASDASGRAALDTLPGFVASGDLAGVGADLLDGRAPVVDNPLGWPLPPGLVPGDGPGRVVVTDRQEKPDPGVVHLRPPCLVVGVGSSSEATAADVEALLDDALRDAGLSADAIALVATIDRRRRHPAVVGLGRPVRSFPAGALAEVDVPSPSNAVARAVGSPSVAEAAALLAAGPGGQLVVEKRRGARATVAVARRHHPLGQLSVVGLGPGHPSHRTPAASAAVRAAEVVIGYTPYLAHCEDLLSPAQRVLGSSIGAEQERAATALEEAAKGKRVALVCSGDPGVYAMASLVLERAGSPPGGVEVEVVPGITAALSASSVLGAPLGHDHVSLSLSDLLTPWDVIEARLEAAGAADLVVALYNPRSRTRTWQLDAARHLLLRYRSPDCVVGVVADAYRPDQRAELTTLADLDVERVDMRSLVVVGSSTTRLVAGRMLTPRGYKR